MKKFFSVVICICLLSALVPAKAYALDDNGKIDLYEVFSNKEDRMKTEVGSRVYKWSMHLPDDAIIYRSEQANYFNMSTTSYQASIDLQVNKNKDKLSLEDMLYKMQNSSRQDNYWIWGDKEFYVDIVKDSYGERYIRVIKAENYYDYYMVDKAAEEFRDYIENRVYIANDYIYNLTVRMNGEFYRAHEDMFDKLVSSFRPVFDDKNPYIKELSDSVSTSREYKNTSYGWKIMMSPYWKVDGSPNARHQNFKPVYTDEELRGEENKEAKEDNIIIPEGITVSLISSAQDGESASKWAQKEIELLKDNYNNEVYEILRNDSSKQNGIDVHHVVIRYKTITQNPYIVHNLYAIGNGYKYLVSATMKDDKFLNDAKRDSYENMISSFTLDSSLISKYLGKIVAAESLLNIDSLKELKTLKYDFVTKLEKSWDISSSSYDYYGNYYYDDYYYKYAVSVDIGNINNNEAVNAYEPTSKAFLNMSAGLNANEINKIVSDRVQRYISNDEIKMSLAKVSIESGKCDGAEIYRIAKEYDLNAIKNFVSQDPTKMYNLEELKNEYEYIVKIDKDIFLQSVTIPVANTTDKNKLKIDEIWKNTSINKVNYSSKDIKWSPHTLDEYDKDKVRTDNLNDKAIEE